MGSENKEPDFYPFRLKDHGWVLKKGIPIETIGETFKDIVYQLVTKDFTPGSTAESMYNSAVDMMKSRSEKARKAAEARWGQENTPPNNTQAPTSRNPRNKQEFMDYVTEEDLNISLAIEWLEIHKARRFTDQSGQPIQNWKGAVKNYCKSKENRQ